MCGDEFEDWIEQLNDMDQPVCNIDDPENCDSCGS
jgi:hypothetical protein